MGLIGHNGGPSLAAGQSWRSHCWRQAREQLLPHLPLEVLRQRVKRAKELGLDYKSYASIRAQTGHDVVAFLFSSNALRVTPARPALAAPYLAKLSGVEAETIALAVRPLTAEALAEANPLFDESHGAPYALAAWRVQKEMIRAALGKRAADRVVLVGDHRLEAEWCAAGRLGGYIAAERYFGPQ